MSKRRRSVCALVFGSKTLAYCYFFGGRLVPDTQSYSEGGSCWSSIAACSMGAVGGFYLLMWASVVCSLAFGWFVADAPFRYRVLLFLFPFGMHASADAIGVAALAGFKRWHWGMVIPLSAAHLVVGLVFAFGWSTRRLLGGFAGIVAGFGAWFGQGMLGYFHLQQIRYLLPAIVYFSLFELKNKSAQADFENFQSRDISLHNPNISLTETS